MKRPSAIMDTDRKILEVLAKACAFSNSPNYDKAYTVLDYLDRMGLQITEKSTFKKNEKALLDAELNEVAERLNIK